MRSCARKIRSLGSAGRRRTSFCTSARPPSRPPARNNSSAVLIAHPQTDRPDASGPGQHETGAARAAAGALVERTCVGQSPAPGEQIHCILALERLVGGLALDAFQLEKHINCHNRTPDSLSSLLLTLRRPHSVSRAWPPTLVAVR